jgi:hypothetical protein
MAWEFVLTDLAGVVIGQIQNADSRKVTLPHLRVPTASFTIPLWHTHATTVMDSDCLLRCYRTDALTGTRTLAFNGPVITAEESGEAGQTIAVTAAGPYWRLARRHIGTTVAGISWGVGAPVDLGLIAHNILDTVNGADFTGIDKGTRTGTSTGLYGPVWLKPASEAIAELSAGVSSFEMEVTPVEPVASGGVGGWPRIGLMNIAPTIGTTRPDAIFEYGDGSRNVVSYNRKVDREGMANRVYIGVQGWPDTPEGGELLLSSNDATSQTNRGLLEAVANDNGVISGALRQQIADFHILYRKNPRQQITFKPAPNAYPAPFTHYKVGDTVRARAVVRDNVRFDALFRVWGLSFEIDSTGNEDTSLELVIP